MGFLIAEMTLMLLLAGACGVAFGFWWVRRQYRDVTAEQRTLKVELDAAQARLAAPPLELTPREEPRPPSSISPEALSSLLNKVEQAVSGNNDAQMARVKALEGQLRTLSRQLQDVLPHPVDGQDIARRLDTLGAAMPQPKLNHVEARLGRLETMIAGLCAQAGTEVPPVPALSRLPSSPMASRLPSSPVASRLPSSPSPASNPAPSGPPSSIPPRAPRPRRTEQL